MEWPKVLILIGVAMLLLRLVPGAVHGVVGALDWVVAALVVLFVYGDARARGARSPEVAFWTGLMFFAAFYRCSLPVLIVYVLITRARR